MTELQFILTQPACEARRVIARAGIWLLIRALRSLRPGVLSWRSKRRQAESRLRGLRRALLRRGAPR